MMAVSHSVSGALGFAALAPLGQSMGLYELDLPSYIVGTMVCAGAALLPDIDHPKARLSNSFGPITRGLAKFTETAAGGHRHMTHTIWFVIAAFLVTVYQNVILMPLGWAFTWLGGVLPAELGGWVTTFGASFENGQGGAFLIIMYMVTMGLLCANIPIVSGLTKSRKVGGFAILPPILGALGGWWVVTQATAPLYGYGSWLPYAVALGALLHDAGDMLTSGKVPFFELPVNGFARKFRIGIPILGDTSSARESFLRAGMGVAFLVFIWLGVQSFDPSLPFIS